MRVWKSDEKLLSICILNFSFKNDFVWEEISNIRHSVSSPDETSPRSSSKILRCASYFQLSQSVFHLVMKHCVSCLIYYFHKLQVTQRLITTVGNQRRFTHTYTYIVDIGFSGRRGLTLITSPGVWEGIHWVWRNNFLRGVGAVFGVFHVLSKHFLLE